MSQTDTEANEAVQQDEELDHPYSPSTPDEFDTYMEELLTDCVENGMDPSQLLSVLDEHESRLLELDRILAEQGSDE